MGGIDDAFWPLKETFVSKGVTGALMAQALADGDLSDILKEIGIDTKLQQKRVQIRLQAFYKPAGASATGPAHLSTTTTSTAAATTVGSHSSRLSSSSSLLQIPLEELYVEASPSSRLGQGSFGLVYRGQWRPSSKRGSSLAVALKVCIGPPFRIDEERVDNHLPKLALYSR